MTFSFFCLNSSASFKEIGTKYLNFRSIPFQLSSNIQKTGLKRCFLKSSKIDFELNILAKFLYLEEFMVKAASIICSYPVHRHKLPVNPSLTDLRVNFSLDSSMASNDIIKPGVQYPH